MMKNINLLLSLTLLCVCHTAQAKTPVTIPIEVGVGPSTQYFYNQIPDHNRWHTGLKIDLAAVINQEIIQKFKKKIPKKYRKLAKKINEVRFRPSPIPFIPTTLIISPNESNPNYGAIWDTFGVGTALGPIHLDLGLPLVYSYIGYTEGEEQKSMHLFRPSLSVKASINIQFSKAIGLTLGWREYFMPPQTLGGSVLDFSTDTKNSIWHMGQGFATLNFRIFKDLKL